MKLDQITQKTDQELSTMLVDARRELSDAIIDSRTKQQPNVKVFASHKRRIARILTIQRQRELTHEETK